MKLLAATCLSIGLLCTHSVPAMILNPRGTGQVLIFPYFTVNRHQQTLISVSNLTGTAKAARVRFREAYDGREVLDFNVFLAPHSTWTSVLFSLDDAGLSGAGAAILRNDTLCTAPAFSNSNHLADGRLYQPFLNYAYADDSGPRDDTRTREGYFEIIEMAELSGATAASITPVNGIPPGCARVATGDVPATDLLPPTGGLSGSEAIVDVPIGTFYASNATALDGVYTAPMYTSSGSVKPDLRDASAASNGFVTAYVPAGGALVTLNYPPEQAIDAASALLAASDILVDYDFSAAAGAQTDWVITFPTKHFYVDPAIVNAANAIPPFTDIFGDVMDGRSDVKYFFAAYDRNGTSLTQGPIGITPTPPPPPPPPPLPYETQVVTFALPGGPALDATPALGSVRPLALRPAGSVGVADLSLGEVSLGHTLRASHEGYSMQGLPVIGFAAINYVNANVTPGVLANYSAALPMRTLAPCLVDSSTSAGTTCP